MIRKKKGFQDAQSRDLNGLSGFRPRNAEKKKSGKKKLKSKLEKKSQKSPHEGRERQCHYPENTKEME